MSAEATEEPGDEQESEPTEESEDERPAIDDDERADVDLDDLDLDTNAVEDEAGAGSEEEAGDGEDPDDETIDESGAQPALPDGESWGDQYVAMLALLLGEIAESGDGETDKDAEAIEDLARNPPVQLDDAVDQWLDEAGMGTDLSPGKQVAIGTGMLAVVVILTETDLAQDAISQIADDMDLNL